MSYEDIVNSVQKALRFVLYVSPVLAAFLVVGTDYFASTDRQSQSIDNATKYCEMIWHAAAEAYRVEGPDALPIQEQTAFDSLDIYAGNKKGFVTNPRFWPNAVAEGLHLDTAAHANAMAGTQDARIIDDYREYPVISAYGPVMWEGERHSVMVEIDVSEVRNSVRKWWYHVDDVGVSLLAFLALVTTWGLGKAYSMSDNGNGDAEGLKEYLAMSSKDSVDGPLLRETFRKMGDVAVLVRQEGYAIAHVSQAACDLFKSTEHTMRDTDLNSYMPDPERHKALMDGFIRGSKPTVVTDVVYKGRPVSLRISKFMSGADKYLLAVARDREV